MTTNNCLTVSNFATDCTFPTANTGGFVTTPVPNLVADLWPQWFEPTLIDTPGYAFFYERRKPTPDINIWVTQHFHKVLKEFEEDFCTGSGFPKINARYCKDKQEYVVEAILAGYPKDNVKVSIDCGKLCFSYDDHNAEKEGSGEKWLMREIRRSSFSRTLRLPETVDTENLTTSYNDGVLTLVFPVLPQARRREIEF